MKAMRVKKRAMVPEIVGEIPGTRVTPPRLAEKCGPDRREAGAGSLPYGGAPPNNWGGVCGRLVLTANLGKWEPGLDRLDDLIPEDLCRAPACPPPGLRV